MTRLRKALDRTADGGVSAKDYGVLAGLQKHAERVSSLAQGENLFDGAGGLIHHVAFHLDQLRVEIAAQRLIRGDVHRFGARSEPVRNDECDQ